MPAKKKQTPFTIQNDRLYIDGVSVPYVPTPNKGGRMQVRGIVYHDTAGRLDKGSSVSWFKQKKARVSAHVVIELDGSITQMVPFDTQAWHAGKSSWMGRRGCNNGFVGVEIVNPGKLTSEGRAWFGETFNDIVFSKTDAHGAGYWLPYTPEQLKTVRALHNALVNHYQIPDRNVVCHYHVSPRRKIDANPLFPIEAVRQNELPQELQHAADGGGDVAAYSPWPLRIGSEGPSVQAVQERLVALGYETDMPTDGDYGPRTRAAVVAWEIEQGHGTDGELSADEYDSLLAETAKPLPKGPLSEAKVAKRKSSGMAAESTAAAVAVGAAVETVSQSAGGSLWWQVMTALEQASEAASRVTGAGVPISPTLATAGLVAAIAVALWMWIRGARS
jgi:N-acetyl-anhydromuramyl-L-alanine amidase AmpD